MQANMFYAKQYYAIWLNDWHACAKRWPTVTFCGQVLQTLHPTFICKRCHSATIFSTKVDFFMSVQGFHHGKWKCRNSLVFQFQQTSWWPWRCYTILIKVCHEVECVTPCRMIPDIDASKEKWR